VIRVFVADDHPLVRIGLRALLAEQPDLEVVGEAADGRQALNAGLDACDVLLLDLSLPIVGGVEVLRRVRERHPALAIVVHSMHPEEQFAHRVLAAGAAAYVPKERPPRELIEAIRAAVRAPGSAPSQPVAPPSPHAALSAREHQIFLALVEGRTVSEVAAELDLHTSTVSNHLANAKKKIGVATIAELVAYAYAQGILATPPT